MKKTFFSLMAVLVMGSLCFISCNNDDKQKDEPTPEQEEKTPIDVNFVVAIAENQLNYIVQTFELDVNGKTVKFSISDMNKVNDKSQYETMKSRVDLCSDAGDYEMYDYKLGQLSDGQSISSKNLSFKILPDRPKDNSLNYLQACELYNVSNGKPTMLTYTNNYPSFGGVKDSTLNEFVEDVSEFFDFKYTY